MKFIKKLLIVIIWFSLLSLFIMLFYTDIMSDFENTLSFKHKYIRKAVVEEKFAYNNTSENNIISKNNFSINLSNMTYEKEHGNLKLGFEFYTEDKQILNDLTYLMIIFDDQKLFYIDEMKMTKYIENESPYKKLDRSRVDTDYIFFNNSKNSYNSEDKTQKNLDLELHLDENYNILNNLNIEFWDVSYKTVDEFALHKVMEPLGVYKFKIDFYKN